MARKKKKPTSLGFFPMLTKPSAAIGKQASVPGPYWTNARQRTRKNASCARGRRVQGSSRFWPGQHSATIDQFKDKEKIVNEFALLYHVRKSFPLHYIVFKQTASHLPHEGNSEQLFSRAGFLSDDNGKMDPARLAVWTSIGVNYETYEPPWEKVLERYMLKFSKGGKGVHEDDLGLLDPDGEDNYDTMEVEVQPAEEQAGPS